MQEETEGASKVFWEVELKRLNDSLPQERKLISELLKDDFPFFTNIAGEKVMMDKAEINEISKIVPNARDGEVRLPLVIIKEAATKKGVYRVEGNAAEVKTINSVLGKDSDNQFIFRPEILELCKKFPTLIVFGFFY
jgi:uncharacterized protein (UPF0216 family)